MLAVDDADKTSDIAKKPRRVLALQELTPLAITSRALAAILGGYALTSACVILLATLLPLTKAESVLASSMLSFAIYTGVIIWVFAVRSLKKVWLTLIIGSTVMAGLGLLLTKLVG